MANLSTTYLSLQIIGKIPIIIVSLKKKNYISRHNYTKLQIRPRICQSKSELYKLKVKKNRELFVVYKIFPEIRPTTTRQL